MSARHLIAAALLLCASTARAETFRQRDRLNGRPTGTIDGAIDTCSNA